MVKLLANKIERTLKYSILQSNIVRLGKQTPFNFRFSISKTKQKSCIRCVGWCYTERKKINWFLAFDLSHSFALLALCMPNTFTVAFNCCDEWWKVLAAVEWVYMCVCLYVCSHSLRFPFETSVEIVNLHGVKINKTTRKGNTPINWQTEWASQIN